MHGVGFSDNIWVIIKHHMDYFEVKLDDKNRLTLPAEIRSEFEKGAILTFGFASYLHLYPAKVWHDDVEPTLAVGIFDEEGADNVAHIIRGKTLIEPDNHQGRITIKRHLAAYADIDKEVVGTKLGKYWRITAKEKAV